MALTGVVGVASHARAETPAELVEIVRSACTAMSRDVDSIEFRYTFDLNGLVRHCVWRQAGDRFYYGGLWIAPDDTRSFPDEVAWDGELLSSRPAWGVLNFTKDRRKTTPGSPGPLDRLWRYVDYAIGVKPPTASLRFNAPTARRVEWQGQTAIEITASASDGTWIVTSIHPKSTGYLPAQTRAVEVGTDRVIFEMGEVETFTVDSAGKVVHLPSRYRAVSGPSAAVPNNTVVVIDRESVRVNYPLRPEHFRIQPYPVDQISDLDAQRTLRAPLDPKWRMDESVGFPFNVFFEGIDTSTLGEPEPVRAAGAAAVGGTEHWSRLPMLLIAASIALAIYAVVLMLRRRFAGS